MKTLKGINGISQVTTDNLAAALERQSATIDYVAMMADVDVPVEDVEVSGIDEEVSE